MVTLRDDLVGAFKIVPESTGGIPSSAVLVIAVTILAKSSGPDDCSGVRKSEVCCRIRTSSLSSFLINSFLLYTLVPFLMLTIDANIAIEASPLQSLKWPCFLLVLVVWQAVAYPKLLDWEPLLINVSACCCYLDPALLAFLESCSMAPDSIHVVTMTKSRGAARYVRFSLLFDEAAVSRFKSVVLKGVGGRIVV